MWLESSVRCPLFLFLSYAPALNAVYIDLKADVTLGHLARRKSAKRAVALAPEYVGDIEQILVVQVGDRAFDVSEYLHSARVSGGKPLHPGF